MRYPASEKAEIIQLVEQSHLPAKRTLDKLGIPRATFYRWYDRQRQDHSHQPALADGLHLSQDHWLGVVLSLHRARRLLALHRGLEAVCYHGRRGRDCHA